MQVRRQQAAIRHEKQVQRAPPPGFRRVWWEAHDIRGGTADQKVLNHPRKGMPRFEYATFQANDDPALKLTIHTPL